MKMILFYIVLSLSASHALELYEMSDLMRDMGVEEETIVSIEESFDKIMRFDLTGIADMIENLDMEYLRGLIPSEREMKAIAEAVSQKIIDIYEMIIEETPDSGEPNVFAPDTA